MSRGLGDVYKRQVFFLSFFFFFPLWTEYIVYYTTDPSVDTKLWLVKTTKKKSTSISDVMPHTSYYFRVQARNAAGYGPLSDTVVYSPPTGVCVCVCMYVCDSMYLEQLYACLSM